MRIPPGALSLLRQAASHAAHAHLVGGTLRDLWLGRGVSELDIACGNPLKAAKSLAAAWRGSFVPLDPSHGIYRVAFSPARRGIEHVDVVKLAPGGIAEDLLRRDFTINAMAVPLSRDLPAALSTDMVLDPRGGLRDLERRLIRTESPRILEDDPLRILRAFRIAAQLGFSIERRTMSLIRRRRGLLRKPAAERIQSELLALLAVPGCSRWVRLMDACRVLTAVFEELEPSRRCALEYYGAGGVMTHTLDALDRADFMLERLSIAFPGLEEKILTHLAAKPGGVKRHRAVLMLAVLLHDVAKPSTAKRIRGRLRFFGHDKQGAKAAADILRRLRFSRDGIDTVRAVTAHHLRPGNLAAGGLVTDRGAFRFFRDTGEHAVSLLLAAWADHASYLTAAKLAKHLPITRRTARRLEPSSSGGEACAGNAFGRAASDRSSSPPGTAAPSGERRTARGRSRPEGGAGADSVCASGDSGPLTADTRKTLRHLWTIQVLLERRLAAPSAEPERLLDGNDVMRVTGIPPSPKVGELLDKVAEAQAEGRLKTRGQALSYLERFKKA